MPRLDLSDLPPNPPPYDGKNKLLVLAYPMSDRHILWWAEKYNARRQLKNPDHTPIQYVGDAVLTMGEVIPSPWTIATVWLKDGGCSFAWRFISNREKKLKLANDLESIEKVRRIIRAKGPPQWLERVI